MQSSLPVVVAPVPHRFLWNGSVIEVRCYLAQRYAFLASETRLLVDGIEIGRSGGFAMNEVAAGWFRDPVGQMHHLEVISDVMPFSPAHLHVRILIDGLLVAQGPLAIENIGDGLSFGVLVAALIAAMTLL
jgi:hypothetical protein